MISEFIVNNNVTRELYKFLIYSLFILEIKFLKETKQIDFTAKNILTGQIENCTICYSMFGLVLSKL